MNNIKERFNTLRKLARNARPKERQAVGKRMDQLAGRAKGTSFSTQDDRELTRIKGILLRSIQKKRRRLDRKPAVTYPESLPIVEKKDIIIETIRNNQVTVVTGETGSGKTTQIPKFCLDAGRGITGTIGLTQPRRIAATSVSRRIAEELKEDIGRSVGYKIRFDDSSRRDPFIKVMTDGILLMEMHRDPLLWEYDTLIIDEAHERSINIDFILGHLRQILTKRRDLKAIITSATIDPEKFSSAFENAPIIEVSGRMYPVEVRYSPPDSTDENGDTAYVEAAAKAANEIIGMGKGGIKDILIFMPTEQDIRDTCDIISSKRHRNTLVLPLYGRLSASEQQRVFKPFSGQKVIVATNVAETSITLPGIGYVIDTGLARIAEYSPSTRTKRLPVRSISQSSAKQRKGRAGRVQNGIAIRLYSEDDLSGRPLFTPPEIRRSNLAEVILRMMALDMGDVASFPFIDPPSKKTINDGLTILRELGAIRKAGKNYILTRYGKRMARFPVDPRLARMILEAEKQGCLHEIIVLAAVLSIQDPKERPHEREEEADRVHRTLANPSSDFITLMTIWNRYNEEWEKAKSNNRMRKFCKSNFLSFRRMKEWRDIYNQLWDMVEEYSPATERAPSSLTGEDLYEGIHKSILSGFLSQIALKKEKNIYRAPKGKEVMIFPGSGIFKKGGEWIVAAETVETSRIFARTAATIKGEWLEEIGAHLCKSTYQEPHWEKNRGEVVAYEKVTLFGLPVISGRSTSFGRIKPEEASKIFIRAALIEGEVKTPLPFLEHNLKLIKRVSEMESKIRRRNILIGEEILAEFYEERLPGIYDIRTLKKHIKDEGNDEFLRLSEEDIIKKHPEEALDLFPDNIEIGSMKLPLRYHFEPGSEKDGITVEVPSGIASTVPLESAELKIPGMLREKIAALLKGLPKEYRKKLVPIPATVERVIGELETEEGSLISNLAAVIYKRYGLNIPAQEWPGENLPEHLRMRFSLLDGRGREVEATRNVNLIREKAPQALPSRSLKKARKLWERSGIDTWDFDELPDRIFLEEGAGNFKGTAFPALTDEQGTLSLRLFQSLIEAEREHRRGLLLLYRAYLKSSLKDLKKGLKLPDSLKGMSAYFGGIKALEEALQDKTLTGLCDLTIRKKSLFEERLQQIRPVLYRRGMELKEVCVEIMKSYAETRSVLDDLERKNRTNASIVSFIEKLRNEARELVPADFILTCPDRNLGDLPRYLLAVATRARRGINDLGKDRLKESRLESLKKRMEDLRRATPAEGSSRRKEALEEFRWMLEEYKISLFAPEIKTKFAVSEKKLQERAKEIERLV